MSLCLRPLLRPCNWHMGSLNRRDAFPRYGASSLLGAAATGDRARQKRCLSPPEFLSMRALDSAAMGHGVGQKRRMSRRSGTPKQTTRPDPNHGGRGLDERHSGAGLAEVQRVHVDQVVSGGQDVDPQLVRAEILLQATNAVVAGADGHVDVGTTGFDRGRWRLRRALCGVVGAPVARISCGAFLSLRERQDGGRARGAWSALRVIAADVRGLGGGRVALRRGVWPPTTATP